MITLRSLKLGDAANLLYGFRPVWDLTNSAGSPFYAPPVAPTATFPAVVEENADARWSLPIITIHADAQSLISELYAYRVLPFQGEQAGFSVPAGPLVLDDADSAAAAKALSDRLGLDLTLGYSYMLVRLRRQVGHATHEFVRSYGDRDRDQYLTAQARAAFARLAEGTADEERHRRLSVEQAQAYLAAFYQYGTHFVSRLEAGDMVWQVFAYTTEDFAALQASFDHDSGGQHSISGFTALAYEYYTTPVNQSTGRKYGYASAHGDVNIWSGDPNFATSVKKGEWQDAKYLGGNSIFGVFQGDKNDSIMHRLNQVVPIGCELTPLGALIPVSPQAYRAQWWNRLLKGSLLQKYDARIQVPFGAAADNDWLAVLPEASDSWLSTIATPTVDVYQERVDLGAIQLTNTDAVQSFTVFGQVIHARSPVPIDIPGTAVTLVSYIIDTSADGCTPVLRLTDAGFESMVLACGEMFGALIVQGQSNGAHCTLVDGFVFATGPLDRPTGRSTVALTRDIYASLPEAVLSRLITSLQFSMVTAESLLYARSKNISGAQQLIREYLDWVAAFIPAQTQDAALAALRVQALYLARIARNLGTEGVRVPYLTYATYEPYVASIISTADALSDQILDYQNQIRDRKQAELIVKTAEELNDNIKKTGALLTDYFAALAKNQRDMANFYGQIAEQKRGEFDKSVTNTNQLRVLLQEQQKAVDTRVEEFQKVMIEWETEQIIKFVLEVATDLFKVGTSFMIPAGEIEEVKALGLTAQKIQKVLNVLEALAKLEEGIEKQVRTLIEISRTLQELDGSVDLPSSREWQEFSLNMEASLAGVPYESRLQQAKGNLVAAVQILSLRGQAWLEAQAQQRQLLTELYYNQQLQQLNAAQADRMAALSSALHLGDISKPDVSSIDLIGLTGQTQFQLRQVLAMLARTLIMQDAAVQYEYLGQPTPIDRFDLITLKSVMMNQKGNIISALEHFNPPPAVLDSPIVYRIKGVPVHKLIKGSIYQTLIQPSATEFFKYAMVRINRVAASVEGISGSDSGQYIVNLTCQANPFEDRDPSRKTLTFNTVERHFGPYDYDIATGKILFGDQVGTIGKNISAITPFAAWQFSLPDSATNRNLTFKGPTVDIVLTFYLTALLVDSDAVAARRRRRMLPAADVPQAADDNAPTLQNLLNQMYTSQAVLKGWDVLFNLMEEPVNQFLASQYTLQHQNKPPPIEVGFCQDFGGFSGYTKFSVTLDAPLLQFEQNNHDFVTVTQPIIDGYIQVGSRETPEGGCKMTDPDIKWGPQQKIDLSSKPYVQGSVALSQVQGLVESVSGSKDTRSVVLDFKKGSFVAQNLKITTNVAELNTQLSSYYQNSDIRYIINTVSFDAPGQIDALKPGPFLLNVLTTNSGKNILQIFITTVGKQQNNLTINVNEPIPNGYDNSLMISTRIMFRNIFVESFNQGSTDIKVDAVDPKQDFLAWSAQVASGTVSGNLDFQNKDNDTQFRISASGNGVTWDIAGLQFQRDIQQGLVLSYTTKKTVGFEYRKYYPAESAPPYGYSPAHYGDWHGADVDVNVDIGGHYPITVQGTGKLQSIQIADLPPDVNVDNTSLSPRGACECNDNDLKIRVRDELKKDIPDAIKKQIGGTAFQAVSIFALANLLFPAENFIQMKSAYVPGDLIVLGAFNTQNNS